MNLVNSGDRTRDVLGSVSAICAAVLIVLFVVSLATPYFGFVSKLAIWFALFLSLFHWSFARRRSLTAHQVRALDYWYLGAAALGIFILASSYSARREAFFSRFVERSDAAREYHQDVLERARDFSELACGRASDEIAQPICRASRSLLLSMHSGRLDEGVRIASVELRRALDERRRELGLSSDDSITLDGIMITTLVLMSPLALKPPIPETFFEGALRVSRELGQILVWPFVLAIAFALRITKVTIEVLAWADAKPVTIPSVAPST